MASFVGAGSVRLETTPTVYGLGSVRLETAPTGWLWAGFGAVGKGFTITLTIHSLDRTYRMDWVARGIQGD